MRRNELTYLGFDGLKESSRVIRTSLVLKALQLNLGLLQLLLSSSFDLFELLEFHLSLLDVRKGRLQGKFRFRDLGLEVSDDSFLCRKGPDRTVQLSKSILVNSDTGRCDRVHLLLQVIVGLAAGWFTILLNLL